MNNFIKKECTSKCRIKNDIVQNCQIIYVNGEEDCRGEWKLMEEIARGYYGVVYKVCDLTGDCNFVYKYVGQSDDLVKEVDFQDAAAKKGLALNIIEVIKGGEDGGIIMEAATTTMTHEIIDIGKSTVSLEEKTTKIQALLTYAYQLVDKLRIIGLAHGDAHLGNFMQKATGEWVMIDFGLAKPRKGIKFLQEDSDKILHSYDKLTMNPSVELPSMDEFHGTYWARRGLW